MIPEIITNFEYKTVDSEEKRIGVDLQGVISQMSIIEDYHGVTDSRLADNWYSLKRMLLEIAARNNEAKSSEGEDGDVERPKQ
jgi:hypothetical protein